MTPKQASELPHGATRPAPLAAQDGNFSTDTAPRATAPPAWPDGLAGLVALGAVLATALGSALWLGSTGSPGLDGPHVWPVVLNIVAIALLAGYVGLLIRQLRQKRFEVLAAMAQIQKLAAHDELTGLWNRRHAQQAFPIELQRASRNKRPLCLALVDIDNLKQINDHQGHAAGDAVLRAFAQEAGVALRKTDLLARWNGEEFLVLLPETSMDAAVATLDRLRQRVDDASVGGLAAHAVTVSIGVTLHGPNESLEATVDRANHALYIARVKGQNRVTSV